ncbi:hypothetical protein [Acinetobacter soli]|uniref:hypothetical protein n=1 Tax=Acinetobacter soli TaxID=487316 RepID=UPI00125E05D3|nr:hypothetical protein [Acinetobacter soli]HAV5548627.1 hypothetical protein [Acinetobacter baumannii]
MVLSQLKDFINAGLVDQIELRPKENGFEIWIINFENALDFSGTLLQTDRVPKAKLYTSLDRAYKAINELGYKGSYIVRNLK